MFTALLISALSLVAADEKLYQSEPLPAVGFTEGIEGPSCDPAGSIYAVAFLKAGNIGRVTPDGKAEVFLELPNKSTGNGIIFDPQGTMYIADDTNHNVLKVDIKTKAITVLAHNAKMNQPNDLAMAPDGTIYASDPSWKEKTGQIWKVTPQGELSLFSPNMGTTNGIEVSPDGKTLYCNESAQRNIWSFDLTQAKPEKKLFKKYDDFGFDGMRADVDGNLYIARYGKGVIAKVSPTGEQLMEIDCLGTSPSNVCFGGPDGRTVYVTEVEHRRLVKFRVDRPGLAWQRFQDAANK
jgi:gluconolactonase